MTGLTRFEIHVIRVFFMAFHALRDQLVSGMALVARKVRVGTGVGLYFLTLLCMTGETRSGQFTL
jgi:hypothetical protein